MIEDYAQMRMQIHRAKWKKTWEAVAFRGNPSNQSQNRFKFLWHQPWLEIS
jgi:hypothetical protein